MLDVGASVPDFKLKSHEGEEVSLGQFAGKWVVLHTFPFAFTGGWTSQTASFNRALTKFEEKNAQVLGMSIDSMFSLKNWGMGLGGIKHPLLADFWPHGAVSKSLGIFNEDTGFANRALFIIDPKGVVQFSELHQGTLPDVDTTLAKLAELQG